MSLSPTPKLFGSDRRYERWRWQIFGITWLAYVGFYLTRKSFAVAKSQLKSPDGLGFTDPQMAWIDGGYLTAYAVGMVICGVCGDRFGPRRVVLFGILGSVLAALAMGSAKTAAAMFLFSTLQGLFQSTGWAPLSKNLTNFFSQHERGVVMGLWCTNYALGGFLGNTLAGQAAQAWGWRASFVVPAFTLLGILILFSLLQRNQPEDVGLASIEKYHNEIEPPPEPAGQSKSAVAWRTVREVLTNPMVLLLAAIYFCLKPARYAILNWGPLYVSERLGVNSAASGMISGLFDLAGPISVIGGGIISDRVFGSRRMPVSVICLFLLGLVLIGLDHLPPTSWMLGMGLFLMGILTFAPDSLISGTAAVDFGQRRGASTASGLINGAGSLGAIAGGTLPGFLKEAWGWQGVFTLLAGAVFLAALLLAPKWNALPGKSR